MRIARDRKGQGFSKAAIMPTLQEEIEAGNAKFMAAFDKGDMSALSLLYTEDCKVMPTGAGVLEGRGAVPNVFQHVRDAGAAKVVLRTDEVGPMGGENLAYPQKGRSEVAYERGSYTFYKGDGAVFDHGKYVVIWKCIDGQWYLYTDIFNTSVTS